LQVDVKKFITISKTFVTIARLTQHNKQQHKPEREERKTCKQNRWVRRVHLAGSQDTFLQLEGELTTSPSTSHQKDQQLATLKTSIGALGLSG